MEPIDSWTWTGDSLPSKKNSKRIIQRYGKPSIISSSEYLEWENGFVREIRSLGTKVGKCSVVSVTITAPNRRRWDLSNKWESLADALVKAEYLHDDDVAHVPEVVLRYGGVSEDKKWKVDAEFFSKKV